MSRYIKIGQASKLLGVTPQTLRRWEREGQLLPDRVSEGGTRYYELNRLLGVRELETDLTVAYARVSSHEQKDDLKRQAENLEQYCARQGWRYELIQDLNVKGMLRNRRLARAIADMGFHELRRQLDYKTRLRGNHLEVVDRWMASSKTCSDCGLIKEELPLQARRFRCDGCGFEADRDLNAAFNLFRTVSSTGCQACGEGGSGSSTRWSETILCETGTWT